MEEPTLTIEKFDPHPFVDDSVNWALTKTSYTQWLKVLTTRDFEVSGNKYAPLSRVTT